MSDSLKDYKERLLNAIPIESYIGRYVTLKKQGRYFKGLCPFHSEKTGSFTVTPEKGLYHCFGCGKGGDLIHFVMEIEGLSFTDSLDVLGRYAGIEKPVRAKSGAANHEDRLAEVNRRALSAFRSFLQNGNESRSHIDYLRSRGIGNEMIERFEIGASPDRWQWLTETLQDVTKEAMELGLLREGRGGAYDFYRNRILFPIRDLQGRVAGFGGRALPGQDQEAKYVNSSDSPLFHKGTLLYGLYQGLKEIRSRREVIVVEGYLDVLGLSALGVGWAVAPLGTALTPDHLKLIHRYADSILFLMDGDKAGRNAALKFAKMVADSGQLKAAILMLPEGMDPFDLSKSITLLQANDILLKRIPADLYLLAETLYPGVIPALLESKGAALDPLAVASLAVDLYQNPTMGAELPIAERRGAMERLRELIGSLARPTEQELYLEEGARYLKMDADLLRREWNRGTVTEENSVRTLQNAPMQGREQTGKRVTVDPPLVLTERHLVMELWMAPHLAARYHDRLDALPFLDDPSAILWQYMATRLMTGEIWNPDQLTGTGLPSGVMGVFSGMVIGKDDELPYRNETELPGGSEAIVEDLLREHGIRERKVRIERLKREMLQADDSRRDVLLQERSRIMSELKNLEANRTGK